MKTAFKFWFAFILLLGLVSTSSAVPDYLITNVGYSELTSAIDSADTTGATFTVKSGNTLPSGGQFKIILYDARCTGYLTCTKEYMTVTRASNTLTIVSRDNVAEGITGGPYTWAINTQLEVPWLTKIIYEALWTAAGAETDPVYSGWDKSTGISITESQISDFGTYLTAETDPIVLAISGIVKSDTAIISAATGADIVSLFGEGTCSGYLKSDLTCDVAASVNIHSFAGAPTINDDSGDGYAAGWTWNDTTNGAVYLCTDATVGAAVWVRQNTPRGTAGQVCVTTGTTSDCDLTDSLTIAGIGGSDDKPATCTVDDVYIENDATSGARLFVCEATDSWVAVGADKAPKADPVFTSSVQLPNAAGPTTDAAGEIAIRSGAGVASGVQFYGNALPGSVLLPAWQTKCSTIAGATSASDYMVEQFPYAITIQKARVTQRGATNVIGHFDECDSSGASCVTIDTTADITVTTTATDDGALSNASIDADDVIQWHTTSVSGTNTDLIVCIYYTVN